METVTVIREIFAENKKDERYFDNEKMAFHAFCAALRYCHLDLDQTKENSLVLNAKDIEDKEFRLIERVTIAGPTRFIARCRRYIIVYEHVDTDDGEVGETRVDGVLVRPTTVNRNVERLLESHPDLHTCSLEDLQTKLDNLDRLAED